MNRNLSYVFTKTFYNLESERSRYYLNYLWWIFDPLLHMIVFYLVFDVLLNRGSEDFLVFLLCGLTAWFWFNRTVTNSQASIIQASGIITLISMPKLVFPSIAILQDTVKQSFTLAVLFVFLFAYGYYPSIAWITLPIILIVQFALIYFVSTLIAAIVPFIPDLKFIVKSALQAAFFVSGIFFSVNDIPEKFQDLFLLNPMAVIIQSYREVLLYNAFPDLDRLHSIGVASAFGIIAVIIVYNKIDSSFARTVIK